MFKRIIFTLFIALNISLLCGCIFAAETVYVDGTGKQSESYRTLEEAVSALPDGGGNIVVSGDTTIGDSNTRVELPAKSGKVTVTSINGAILTIARGVRLGCEMEFDNIELANASSGLGYISAMGHKLTIGEGVTTSAPNSNNRYLTIYGSTDSSDTTDYNTHVIVKAGTWRHIFGGGKGVFNGSNATVEVSDIIVTGKLSAKNEEKAFNGNAALIINLKGNKNVSAGSFLDTPELRTDYGYEGILDGNTYRQIRITSSSVYVDGTGKTENAYTALSSALEALSDEGGIITVCGDTSLSMDDLAAIHGEITFRGENNAVLTLYGDICFKNNVTFDGIRIAQNNNSEIQVTQKSTLTIMPSVTLCQDALYVSLEKGCCANIKISAINVSGIGDCVISVNGNTYTATSRYDTNKDGACDFSDVFFLLKALLNGNADITDINNDGKYNLLDVLRILKYILNESEYTAMESKLFTIDELNQYNTAWSHTEDDISKASLETNFRDISVIDKDMVGVLFFDTPYYPRMKKIKDDLYMLTYMSGAYGGERLFYTTSANCKDWATPKILWSNTERSDNGKFMHTEGPLAGKSDTFLAVNPDFCVLENGDILAVYYVRAGSGYSQGQYEPYQKLNGLFVKRGTVGTGNSITWGEEKQLTYGCGWEPTVFQRQNGRIEIYWTNAATSFLSYGTGDWTFTSMIYSDDNGATWTPDLNSGTKNKFMYFNIYQECAGTALPPITDSTGSPLYTEPQPFFKGQMPSVASLYNGKTLLATEVRAAEGPYHISLATSLDNGAWKHLSFGEDATKITEAVAGDNAVLGAAPYVGTFPSGEVFLVYNNNGIQCGRLVSANGKIIDSHEFHPTGNVNGCWGSCTIIDSHKAVSVFPNNNDKIYIYPSYLNHRINAKKSAITLDGYTNDWFLNTDALFVGSESQAQVTLRVAHDTDNIYLLLSLLDEKLTKNDSVVIGIGEDNAKHKYSLTVQMSGKAVLDTYLDNEKIGSAPVSDIAIVPHGTVDNSSDKDDGAIIEIAIPKSKVELVKSSCFSALLVLINNDGEEDVYDTFDGISITDTTRWPNVVLD